MEFRIDGHLVNPQPGQTLRSMICALGLDRTTLSGRPLAAKIAGEVFTLNYIPQREKEDKIRETVCLCAVRFTHSQRAGCELGAGE